MKGADARAVNRLSNAIAKDRETFQSNVKRVLNRFESRKSLECSLLLAMDATQGEMRWGVDDCGLWCGNILREALGYDPCGELRGRYRTRLGARRVLGAGGLPAALRRAARRHGWRRAKDGEERAGDVALAVRHGVPAVVICRAQGWFVGRTEAGWMAIPSKDVSMTWAVI